MQRAFREICGEEGFESHLEKTIQRISDIESLGRTRELVAKDLVLGGRYKIRVKGGEGQGKGWLGSGEKEKETGWEVELVEKEAEEDEGK